MSLTEVLRMLEAAPRAARLARAVQRATAGDIEAVDYLRRDGWAEALEVLSPGAGERGRLAVASAARALRDLRATLTGEVIDAEWREVGAAPPWERFVRWLIARRWGTFVILGPKGAGKTTLAMRLAERWHEATGWPVQTVNAYPEARYGWTEPVSTRRFVGEIHRMVQLLNPPEPRPGEEAKPLDADALDDALEPYRRRIVVIDEMSLAVGTSSQDVGRQLVRQIMAQARHLSWLIVYIGQLAKMMPNDLLNSDVVFVKKPTGREMLLDRDDRLTQDLWERATAAFAGLRQSIDYAPPWDDPRAWAFVDVGDLGSGHGWSGLVPSAPPESDSEEISE